MTEQQKYQLGDNWIRSGDDRATNNISIRNSGVLQFSIPFYYYMYPHFILLFRQNHVKQYVVLSVTCARACYLIGIFWWYFSSVSLHFLADAVRRFTDAPQPSPRVCRRLRTASWPRSKWFWPRVTGITREQSASGSTQYSKCRTQRGDGNYLIFALYIHYCTTLVLAPISYKLVGACGFG